jgi:hypothetical protein
MQNGGRARSERTRVLEFVRWNSETICLFYRKELNFTMQLKHTHLQLYILQPVVHHPAWFKPQGGAGLLAKTSRHAHARRSWREVALAALFAERSGSTRSSA